MSSVLVEKFATIYWCLTGSKINQLRAYVQFCGRWRFTACFGMFLGFAMQSTEFRVLEIYSGQFSFNFWNNHQSPVKKKRNFTDQENATSD